MDSSNKWNEYYEKFMTLVPYTEAFTTLLCMKKPEELIDKKFLEIGCGTGNNLFFAKQILKMDVFGVDYSKNAIKNCQSFLRDNNIDATLSIKNAAEMDYPDETFDVILDRAVIQHNTLKNANKIVAQVFRILKKGGIFISFLASDFHPLFNEGKDLGEGNYYLDDEHGIRHYYTKYEIIKLFSDFSIFKFNLQQKINAENNNIIESFYYLGMEKK